MGQNKEKILYIRATLSSHNNDTESNLRFFNILSLRMKPVSRENSTAYSVLIQTSFTTAKILPL